MKQPSDIGLSSLCIFKATLAVELLLSIDLSRNQST